jgi:hypothetical protein
MDLGSIVLGVIGLGGACVGFVMFRSRIKVKPGDKEFIEALRRNHGEEPMESPETPTWKSSVNPGYGMHEAPAGYTRSIPPVHPLTGQNRQPPPPPPMRRVNYPGQQPGPRYHEPDNTLMHLAVAHTVLSSGDDDSYRRPERSACVIDTPTDYGRGSDSGDSGSSGGDSGGGSCGD